MNAIMMYMSGNSLQIFSIMMTAMLFMNPLKALSSINTTFARFDNERTHARLWPVKLAFIALQLATIALGIWKVNGMGLLPYVALVVGGQGLGLTRTTGPHTRIGSHGKQNDNQWSIQLHLSRCSPIDTWSGRGGGCAECVWCEITRFSFLPLAAVSPRQHIPHTRT
jgi:hypothetical protein